MDLWNITGKRAPYSNFRIPRAITAPSVNRPQNRQNSKFFHQTNFFLTLSDVSLKNMAMKKKWKFTLFFSNGKVYDRRRQEVKYYKDVPDILRKIYEEGTQLGIASRWVLVIRKKLQIIRMSSILLWKYHYINIIYISKAIRFKTNDLNFEFNFLDQFVLYRRW